MLKDISAFPGNIEVSTTQELCKRLEKCNDKEAFHDQ